MTCAKKIVRCIIVAESGDVFYGDNSCDTPQVSCPRSKDEDYTKCKTICNQPGHAEEMALRAAGNHNLKGAIAYMQGTTHFCENCQKQLFDAGIKFLSRDLIYERA